MRKIVAILLASCVAATTLSEAIAAPASAPAAPVDLSQAYPGESYTQYRERVIVREYYGRPYRRDYYDRHYHGRRYYHRDRSGDALAAGAAVGLGALAIGALASQAAQPQTPPPPPATVDPQLAAYCAKRFRSFDPVTGTYMSSNGMRLVCTY